jgi:hypothetical protein
MLKNTKAVGVASAIALLTGVVFAPSATAVFGHYPWVGATSASIGGGVVKYSVLYVLKGCKVITTLGSATRTEEATTPGRGGLVGVVMNKRIPAPSKAGEYTLRSKVANDCATEAGYSNNSRMTEDITVGDEIVADGDWEITGARAVRIFGTAELSGAAYDLGTIKIQAYVKGELISSTYTDSANAGAFSIVIESKYLNKKGNTQVTLKLASNKFYWMDQKFGVDRQVD